MADARGRDEALRQPTVHDGLNLTIRRGERWCVMGKNGAGKSTLLKMIAGALTPDAGAVTLGASLKMGYFAQQSLDLLDPGSDDRRAAAEATSRDESIGALRNLARRLPVLGRRRSTRRSARCQAARRRAW